MVSPQERNGEGIELWDAHLRQGPCWPTKGQSLTAGAEEDENATSVCPTLVCLIV